MTNLLSTLFLNLSLLVAPLNYLSSEPSLMAEKNLPVYKTENLVIKKLSNHIYQHISFLKTTDYGKVACNGMIVIHKNEAVVFDSPTDTQSSRELIEYLKNELNTKVTAIIPTHFHEDCVGGINVFEAQNIQVYASTRTLKLLEQNDRYFSKPVIKFKNKLELAVAGRTVYAQYFGEGHTKDNVIGYSPQDHAIFGGCLLKSVGANRGNLEDASIHH